MLRAIIFLFIIISFAACKPEVYTPKPRGYYHIALPDHEYKTFDSTGFPYRFEYPVYGEVIRNPKFYGDDPDNPYWMNIEFHSIGGKIYMSYKEVKGREAFLNLNEDMYIMTFEAHTKKADYIKDYYFQDPERQVYGVFYSVTGDAASAYQFYATDSAKHFLRGALYFDTAPNADSLQPLNEFLKEDINHMLKTLEWN